jgi:hypothetical protein
MEKTKSVFDVLNAIDVNEHTEEKNGLTYLSWAWAWAEFKKRYPSATYRIVKDSDGKPYFLDERLGIMVYTEVTVEGLTHEMWLPVMDGANKAMRMEPYTYQAWDKKKGAMMEKKVEAATMFDVNKTIMRCLVKNLAMFGLGLYIYAGEDLPDWSDEEKAERKSRLMEDIARCKTEAELIELWGKNKSYYIGDQQVLNAFGAKRKEVNALKNTQTSVEQQK